MWLKLVRSFQFLDVIFYTYNAVIILMTVAITVKVYEEVRI
jgi:hypothetical protein